MQNNCRSAGVKLPHDGQLSRALMNFCTPKMKISRQFSLALFLRVFLQNALVLLFSLESSFRIYYSLYTNSTLMQTQ